MMNALRTFWIAAASVAAMATLPAFARHDRPMARDLSEVESIRVDGALCPSRVTDQLNAHGFFASRDSHEADAVLELDVSTNGDLSDQDSMDEGVYTATLVGARGRVLFRTSGAEDSVDLGSLCDEIGEEIAGELRASV